MDQAVRNVRKRGNRAQAIQGWSFSHVAARDKSDIRDSVASPLRGSLGRDSGLGTRDSGLGARGSGLGARGSGLGARGSGLGTSVRLLVRKEHKGRKGEAPPTYKSGCRFDHLPVRAAARRGGDRWCTTCRYMKAAEK